jgi:sialidase-1
MTDLPNILFIHTEHHRGDSLGCEEHPVLLTPTMDTIAYQGARFRHFYSACPSCIAARRSMLTGQLPQTHGLVGYQDGLEWDGVPTLPGLLRDRGYQTVHIGRSMHQHPSRKGYGFEWMEIGEDYMAWLSDQNPRHGIEDWFGSGVMHNDWTARPWHLDEDLHQTNWTVERALRFMERRDPSRPFFLSLGFTAAHPPFQPPAFYFERYLRTGVPDPALGDWAQPPRLDEMGSEDYVAAHRINLPPEAHRSMQAAYYGLLNHVDDQLRRLINPVKGIRHGDDTIIILTSDHGEMLGDHYRFRKSVAYEGAARVPFLISAPESFGIGRGSVIDAVATHADLMPTLLEMLGIPIPGSVDGLSLYPHLRGELPDAWRDALHIEHAPNHQCLTDGAEKYIWWPGDGREHLFDLKQDPHELHDLSSDAGAAAKLDTWRERLIERLRARPEGFVQEGRLVAGCPYRPVIPREQVVPAPSQFSQASFYGMTLEDQRAYERDTLRRVADLALIPPRLNTSPLPEYDYDRLDYGMTLGIERTPGGRLWAAWVAGEDGPKAYMLAATSDDEGDTWSKPRLVIHSDIPGLPIPRSVIVGNLWTDPLGRLWFFFDQTMNHFDGRGGLWAARCENPDAEAPIWSEPRRLWHGSMLNKPVVLSTGEWLLAVQLLQSPGFGPFHGLFPELDPLRGVNIFVSADAGETWVCRGRVRMPNPDWMEPMVVERHDGSLWMLARTRTGIVETFSLDGGRTWSEPLYPDGIKQPNARFYLRRLASGRILLVKHGDRMDAHHGRVQLSAWLSDDEGTSWQGGLVLDESPGVSYPDGFQAPDGYIYISYDRNRATEGKIFLARFTEDDIVAGRLISERSRLKHCIIRPLGLEPAAQPADSARVSRAGA